MCLGIQDVVEGCGILVAPTLWHRSIESSKCGKLTRPTNYRSISMPCFESTDVFPERYALLSKYGVFVLRGGLCMHACKRVQRKDPLRPPGLQCSLPASHTVIMLSLNPRVSTLGIRLGPCLPRIWWLERRPFSSMHHPLCPPRGFCFSCG